MAPNVTLQQFLAGEPLRYSAPAKYNKQGRPVKHRAVLATYRTGDGIYLEDEKGTDLGKAAVDDDTGARRAYHNLTRGE